ncbi:MAG: PKD domain-containing protein [Cyclobacteriaceae bacterium]|nr:PKD domain-containing protein [Cyclobacteriaceae bacterium]
MKIVYLFLLIILIDLNAFGQPPVADFSIVSPSCQNSKFIPSNNSSNANTYEWDFCIGDFYYDPVINSTTQPEITSGYGYELLEDNGLWYGFVVDRTARRVYRYDYGESPLNSPTITTLSLPDGWFTFAPEDISLIKFNNLWYAVIGFGDNGGSITRLDFGSSLNNDSPSTTTLGNFGYVGSVRKLKLINESGNLRLVLPRYALNSIWVVNYGNSFDNIIDNGTDIYKTASFSDLSLATGIDIKLINGEYIVHIVSLLKNNILRLNFGNSLLNTPVLEGTYLIASLGYSIEIKLFREGANYFGYVTSDRNPIKIFNFGDLTSAQAPTEITYSLALPNLIALDVLKYEGKNYTFGVNLTKYVELFHYYDCSASIQYSTEEQPIIAYEQSGTYEIDLLSCNNSGECDFITHTMTVSASEAPQITSQITGNCLSSPISFDGQQVSGNITGWSWDFGDGAGTSALQNDTYTYASAGTYQVRLNVTDANGCNNLLVDTVQVYEEPIPDFTYPAGSFCMNNSIPFTNTSTGETGPAVNWTWDFNGEGISTDKDAAFIFTTSGSKTIELKSSIPGCANVIQKVIFIEEAPTVDFSFDNVCNTQTTTFSDLSTGNNFVSWDWDFGDGENSTDQNPTHTYADPGQYDVTLIVTNTIGCSTELTQTVYNHNIPTVSFTNDLACSTSPIKFTDQSSVQNANLVAWEWNFGDGNTSSDENPQYVYNQTGDFTVQLKAYSEFGCVDSAKTTLSVIQGPEVDFSWDKSCEGETTSFADNTNTFGNTVDSWAWIMDGQLKTDENPTHSFTASGTYPIQLSVTLANNCSQTLSKEIIVKQSPTLQFSYKEGCGSSSATFYDLTDQTDDGIVSREWRVDGQLIGVDSISETQLSIGSYPVTLSVVTNSGCEKSLTKDITILGSPKADFSTNTSYGAAPLTIQFTNNSTGGNLFEWSFGDADDSKSSVIEPEFTYTQTGTYTVTLKTLSEPNCFDEISKTIEVVAPETSASIMAITPMKDVSKTNFIVTIENTGTTLLDDEISLVFRTDYGAEVVEALTQTIYAGKTNNYLASYALSSSTMVKNICVELVDTKSQNTLLDKNCVVLNSEATVSDPYPNPSNGRVSIDVILETDGPIDIRVLNRAGQEMIVKSYQGVKGLNQLILEDALLTQGIYIVEVSSNGIAQKNKITIVR